MSYNACVAMEVVDHYKVLGVSRDADMEQVKLAYRKAALACHPDNNDGDSEEAERKLRALIEAYKAIAKDLNPGAWKPVTNEGRTLSPQDFARDGYSVTWQPTLEGGEDSEEADAAESHAPRAKARTERNELRILLIFWGVAVFLGIVVGLGVALYRDRTAGPEGVGSGDLMLSVLFGELIYIAVAVAAIVLIVLTRKVVKFTLYLIQEKWKLLPGPSSGNRELPGPSGRELPRK